MFKLKSVGKYVRAILNAFAGLLTKPLEQDLNDSLTAAATSVALAVILPISGLVFLAERPPLEIGGCSIVLILVWMVVTTVATKADQTSLTLARNLSLVSFWITVSLVFVMAVEVLITSRWCQTIRFLIVLFLLILAIPLHTLRNLPRRQALAMTGCLWLSMGVLTWCIIY